MLPNEYKPRPVRPMSEIINPGRFMNEADMAGNWYEDLQKYETNLDEMASATLDQTFKDEMQHVDQWYCYLTEAERTATMYTLLQHSTQVQARFFINLLQQMVKRDPLFSLLTPNNPDGDMQSHLAGAMAKAELEASQRLMSVLPYKTGQVMSRPQSTTTNRRSVDRHSFALGDTEEYTRLFNGRNDLLNNNRSFVNPLLDDTTNSRRLVNGNRTSTSGRTMFNNSGRPHSVIEGDTNLLFPASSTSSNWSNNNNANRRSVGHIGDRTSKIERPKSADISNWSIPQDRSNNNNNGFQSVWSQQHQIIPPAAAATTNTNNTANNTTVNTTNDSTAMDNDLIDFTNAMQQQQQQQPFRRRANLNRIPVVPETDELIRATQDLFLNDLETPSFRKPTPPGIDHYAYLMNTPIVDNSSNTTALDEQEYASDHSDASYMSRRRSSMTPNSRATKDKKAVEVIDMDLLKDIPAWLRSLRLHKYNTIFSDTNWQTIIVMNDADLIAKGVAALGARRKMLKVFENIRAHCDANHIAY